MNINEDETLSPFLRGKINIIQKKKGYRFNLDSVLLANFFYPKKKKGKIIDLGTGSGIILLLISLKYKDLDFSALEYQNSLFDIAKRNFLLNKLNVNLVKGNVKDIKNLFPSQSFDYVITNPPYYKTTGKKPKNQEILIAKTEEIASIEDFIKASFYLLKDNGSFFMINQANRLSETIFLLKKYKLEPKRYRFVYPSLEDKASHFLIEAVKNAKESCEIEKPLIIYKDKQKKIYTPEVESYLES
ncbi:MAG: methyltransferase [Aquificae bacterium]|nr:methyltransferase [Aquificota bacterium]